MKISVITTLCNAVQTIDDCLDAMAAQSHADREHLVIDGDSTDGTLERLQRRRDQLGVLVSEPDGGIYFGLNKGLALATGEVIGILHSDDLYADTEVLARVARAFADPAVQALYGDLVYVPEVLVRMRLGGKSNRNLKQIAQKSWEDYQILRRQGLGGPPGTGPLGALSALAWKNLSKLPQFVRR
ncbi:glycosyltransferase [Lamprobacter modestohalophilus]|uniref:glycosyltransferase n=1 Tax=Lamprobacter modestohalophilus TaxID=1064514 RepID=UPI002ADEAA4F|nr:glycosyltransferase [Lamprobacter modestohalophilus]MEA1049049.1 glycosyltransferase [Lamprobacter modestohalophilus]